MDTTAAHADVVQRIGIGKSGADRLFDQVVDRLALGIVSGRYPAGELLPNEAAFATEVPVSRSSYREALKFLTSKGLIEAKPKTGTRVRPRSAWNLLDPDILRWSLQDGASVQFARDLFELRRTIEPEVARFAALRRTDADLATIADALQRMETLTPLSAASISADLEFHEAVFEASGNRAFASLKGVVSTTILWSQNVKKKIGTDEFTRSLADHRRVYDAIRSRDAAKAHALTLFLVADALDTTEQALAVQAMACRANPKVLHIR